MKQKIIAFLDGLNSTIFTFGFLIIFVASIFVMAKIITGENHSTGQEIEHD